MRSGEWWQEVIFAMPGETKDITRAVVVSLVANKEGAHVDLNLPNEYEAMLASPNLADAVEVGGKLISKPLKDYHLQALRQIGYEVLNSPALIALCENTLP